MSPHNQGTLQGVQGLVHTATSSFIITCSLCSLRAHAGSDLIPLFGILRSDSASASGGNLVNRGGAGQRGHGAYPPDQRIHYPSGFDNSFRDIFRTFTDVSHCMPHLNRDIPAAVDRVMIRRQHPSLAKGLEQKLEKLSISLALAYLYAAYTGAVSVTSRLQPLAASLGFPRGRQRGRCSLGRFHPLRSLDQERRKEPHVLGVHIIWQGLSGHGEGIHLGPPKLIQLQLDIFFFKLINSGPAGFLAIALHMRGTLNVIEAENL